MQNKRLKVGQIELQIREYQHEGDAIIFLHFGGGNLMVWERIIPYFQDNYHLILVDFRGHGKSDKPKTGYHMDELGQDIIRIMQHLNLDQTHIVGSSLGAEVGLSIAAHYPKKILSLVCESVPLSQYGPYSIFEGSEKEFEEHVESELERWRNPHKTIFPSIEALVSAKRENLEQYDIWNEYIREVERYGAYKVEEGKYTSGTKHAMVSYMKHYFECRFENYYRKVKCPLLMLPAEEDLEDMREKNAMEKLRELADQGEIVGINGWKHAYGWLINPEAGSKVILRFLKKYCS